MSIQIPHHEWHSIPGWQTHSLALVNGAGLYRFLLDGCVVFIGYAASAKPGLKDRIYAYRRGDAPNHHATQRIFEMKDKLELQLAFLDLPPLEIRAVGKELIRIEKPTLNKKNAFAGRY